MGGKQHPAEEPLPLNEALTIIRSTSLGQLMIVGYVVPALILWLMVFKPF
jgi:hypothetical protein